jgi:L-gulono-1,4-lactone dehydrogenase
VSRGDRAVPRTDRSIAVRDEDEIAETIQSARSTGGGVRATGSGGSKSEVTSAPDVALRLDAPDRLLDVSGNLVTVPAGMTGGRLQELLREEGLTLPTVGEWRNATVAGSIATGTHGGSSRHGIMSTSVRSLRIVTGTGEVRDIGSDDPDFTHLAVSLGAFGVVTSVTLECAEHFSLLMETDVVSFDEYVGDPTAQESRTEFHSSVWVPSAGRVIRFAADKTPPSTRSVRRRARFGKWTAMANFLARRFGFHGAVSARIFRRTAMGDSADILSPLDVPPRVARFRKAANEVRGRKAAELAVDASRAAEVLTRFDAFFRKHPRPLNNPIGLRMSAADTFSLSPCQGRDTLWLDIFYDATEPFETEFAALANDLGARCHWGKTLALSPHVLRDRYAGWNAFHAARARFDPDEVFANAYTDALGLTGEKATP